jgi:hypothetical protein
LVSMLPVRRPSFTSWSLGRSSPLFLPSVSRDFSHTLALVALLFRLSDAGDISVRQAGAVLCARALFPFCSWLFES